MLHGRTISFRLKRKSSGKESIYRTIYIRKEYAAQIEKLAVRHGISWNRAVVLILQSYLEAL
ncbi:hypothetical protein AGATL06_29530 [Agathobaculum sp. TL06]